MNDRVWYPGLEKHHSVSFSGELYSPRKTSTEAQGLSLAQIYTIGENFDHYVDVKMSLDFSWVTCQGYIAIRPCHVIL